MRVMVMIEGDGVDEDKIAPTEQMLAADGRLQRGVRQRRHHARCRWAEAHRRRPGRFEGGTTSVVDGPFTEAKEIVAGYWVWEVGTLEEAVEWARRARATRTDTRPLLEIRPFCPRDFGAVFERRSWTELAEQRRTHAQAWWTAAPSRPSGGSSRRGSSPR